MKILTYTSFLSLMLLSFSYPIEGEGGNNGNGGNGGSGGGPAFGMASTLSSEGGRMANSWQFSEGVITVYTDDCSMESSNGWTFTLTSTGSEFDAVVHEPYLDCEGPCSSELLGAAEYSLSVDGDEPFPVNVEESPSYLPAQSEIVFELQGLDIHYCSSGGSAPEYGTDKLIFPITGTYDDDGTPTAFSGQVEVLIEVKPNDPLRKRNLASQAMSLFPNPAQNRMIVQFDEHVSPHSTLRILDLQGKQLGQELIVNQSSISLDLSSLQSGMYICEWKTETELVRKKFVKVD